MTSDRVSDLFPTNLIEAALTERYGERCSDFDPGCVGCLAWAELYSLQHLRSPVTVSDAMVERAQEGVTALLKTWTIDKGILRAALTAALSSLHAQPEGLPKLENCGRYLAQDNKGQWHYINHAGTWQGCPMPLPTQATGSREAVGIVIRFDGDTAITWYEGPALDPGTELYTDAQLQAVERERDALRKDVESVSNRLATAYRVKAGMNDLANEERRYRQTAEASLAAALEDIAAMAERRASEWKRQAGKLALREFAQEVRALAVSNPK